MFYAFIDCAWMISRVLQHLPTRLPMKYALSWREYGRAHKDSGGIADEIGGRLAEMEEQCRNRKVAIQ
jgi:hypothetical protein